jgi:hypothetical protein
VNQTEKGDKNSHLTIPAYYLVEWLALNWWSLLYEPRKGDGEDAERDFRLRHWLGTARNGFALPDVTFSPAGDTIEIIARSAFLRFAQLNFIEDVTASVAIDRVRLVLSSFVEQVLARLREKGLTNSDAHEAWKRVKETTEQEEAYCRLIGSMGLSPYVSHPDIDVALETIADKISDSMLTDLCQAASIGSFKLAAQLTEGVTQALAKSQPARLHDLLKVQRPLDATSKAYEWGYRATDAARSALGIANDDPSGHKAFFERLDFDLNFGSEVSLDATNSSLIIGAVAREDDAMQVSVAGTSAARKFAGARAAFLAWSQGRKASRLVTSGKTRDQQASRAFAAELLAPSKYLKKRLGSRGEVSSFALDKISEEMGIASTVVRYQAINNGYLIAEAA